MGARLCNTGLEKSEEADMELLIEETDNPAPVAAKALPTKLPGPRKLPPVDESLS